jgi:hypothetical protein
MHNILYITNLIRMATGSIWKTCRRRKRCFRQKWRSILTLTSKRKPTSAAGPQSAPLPPRLLLALPALARLFLEAGVLEFLHDALEIDRTGVGFDMAGQRRIDL